MKILKLVLLIFFAILSPRPNLASQVSSPQSRIPLDHKLNDQVAGFINEFKRTEDGNIFLRNHSEKGLRISLLFLQCPKRYFGAIQNVSELCSDLWAIQLFFWDLRREGRKPGLNDFYGCLRDNFEKADARNVPILTYLLLACDTGALSESLAERYTRLFEFHHDMFLLDLKQRTNWRDVVRSIMAGDWRAFNAGLSKLGNSEFELKLKGFVASLIKER